MVGSSLILMILLTMLSFDDHQALGTTSVVVHPRSYSPIKGVLHPLFWPSKVPGMAVLQAMRQPAQVTDGCEAFLPRLLPLHSVLQCRRQKTIICLFLECRHVLSLEAEGHLDDLKAVWLQMHLSCILGQVSVHAANHSCNGRL